MTAGDEGCDEAVGAHVVTDEQFVCSVTSEDVLDADEQLWKLFNRFLGADPARAWGLSEVTHHPFQPEDEAGKPVGEMKLASTGTWKRDPSVLTPPRLVVLEQTTDTDDEPA